MNSDKTVFSIIGLLSAAVIGFLFWLIYFKTGASVNAGGWVGNLPALNAILNALTATLLVMGYVLSRKTTAHFTSRRCLQLHLPQLVF